MSTNPYKDGIDFASLALRDKSFAAILKPNGQLDFSDPEVVQQLTKSLLKLDFGLTLALPDDRLCPPVPNRLNYILWVQSLLDTTSDDYFDRYDASREVVGVDVGTGASCIYPLLGCSQRRSWSFIGTDTDEKSLQFAKQNVETNKLQSRIKLLRTRPNSFFSLIPFDNMQVDFTMCNPPFYDSQDEMVAAAASKQRPPFSACTGSANEMVTPGGEVAFVSCMMEESLAVRDECQWFTSMVGKLSSLTPLVEKLKNHDIENYAVTEFVQGSKTRRWALAWSFQDLRPTMSVSRGTGSLQKALLPFPSEYNIKFSTVDPDVVGKAIDATLSSLPLKWAWKASITTGLGFCDKPVWSRAARRQAMKSHQQPIQGDGDDDDTADEARDFAFGFKISVSSSPAETNVCVRWVKGHDSVTYESFCGMIKRKLEGSIK